MLKDHAAFQLRQSAQLAPYLSLLLVMYTPQSVNTGPGFKHNRSARPAPAGNIWFQSKYGKYGDGK